METLVVHLPCHGPGAKGMEATEVRHKGLGCFGANALLALALCTTNLRESIAYGHEVTEALETLCPGQSPRREPFLIIGQQSLKEGTAVDPRVCPSCFGEGKQEVFRLAKEVQSLQQHEAASLDVEFCML